MGFALTQITLFDCLDGNKLNELALCMTRSSFSLGENVITVGEKADRYGKYYNVQHVFPCHWKS